MNSAGHPPRVLGIASWCLIFNLLILAFGDSVDIGAENYWYAIFGFLFVTTQVCLGAAAHQAGKSWWQYGVVSSFGWLVAQAILIWHLYKLAPTSSSAAQQGAAGDA